MIKPSTIAIMTLLTCGTAQACLTKDRAARVWPARELVRDGDGCWTYRRGLMSPVDDGSTNRRASTSEGEWAPAVESTTFEMRYTGDQTPTMMDRWPEETLPLFSIQPPQPAPGRDVFAAMIAVVIATIGMVSIFESICRRDR